MTSGDPTPSGKRKVVSLREKIREIENNIKRGMYTTDMTVCELVEKYLTTKTGVAYSTRQGYQFVQNLLEKESFGQRKIMEVKTSDAKIFLIQLQESGKGYSTVCTVRGVLRPAFQMAADDDMIIKNPFQFELHTVVVNDSVKRDAITREQERKRDMEYSIEETKTSSGTRDIPMTEEVRECLERIVANRKYPKVEPIIDGYTGFLFYDKNNNPMVALNWEKYFHYAVGRYNRTYRVQIPKITPHVCRHTYCSNMARAGMNPKTLQYLMGHSDIGVTLNTYTHLGAKDAREELERLNLAGTSKGKMPRKVVNMP